MNFYSVKDKPPENSGHYLVISNMNWYHGGCFDVDNNGLSLSYNIAYYNHGWNDPYAIAWAELPEIPEWCREDNLKLMKMRRKMLRPVLGTDCGIL